MNGTSSSDEDSVMSELPVLSEDATDEEREEHENLLRQQQMKQLRQCIKSEIDNQLVDELGSAFSYFCNGQYQYKEISGRFVFDIVTMRTEECDDIYGDIDRTLKRGHDLSTLDALRDDDGDGADGTKLTKLGLMQNLYSNLHKQYALKCGMDVGPIQYNEKMESLMGNIVDDMMFDGPHFEISGVLQRVLMTEIHRNVTTKLNTASPDMEKLHEITQQKQSLVKVLKYCVDRMHRHIDFERNDDDQMEIEGDWELSNEQMMSILDQIAAALECLTFFKRFSHQSQLMDECFNNASLSEMEPVYGVENSGRNGSGPMDTLKERLLNIFEFVMDLPVMEDPFDPSAHHSTENLQIRYLMGFARLILINPTYYKTFGGVVVAHLYRPQPAESEKSTKSKGKKAEIRRHDIMKSILRKVRSASVSKYNQMLFEGVKMLMNDEAFPVSIRIHTVMTACRSAAMIDGLSKGRKDWNVYIELFLQYVIGTAENVPRYFVHLHSMTAFFKKFTARDKLDVWSQFRSLSRKLPSSELRTDENAWRLYDKFRAKLKSEAGKAAGARDLGLDEDGLENWDQREAASSQSQSQRDGNRSVNMSEMAQDIQMGVEIVDDDEDDDDRKEEVVVGFDVPVDEDGDGDREDSEVPRVTDSVSRLNVSGSELVANDERSNVDGDGDEEDDRSHDDDDDDEENDGDKGNRRVMIARSQSKDVESGDGSDEDVDMEADRSGDGNSSAVSTSSKKKYKKGGRRARGGKWLKKKSKK